MSHSIAGGPWAHEASGSADPDARPARPIRLLIVDDHEVVRSGLATLLEREPGIAIVGSLASGEETLAQLDELRPDVVLLDHRLPGMSGSAVCAEITRRKPEISVVILTTYVDDDVIHASLVAGARGYVLKDALGQDLIHSIRAVARGDAVLAPQVTDKVLGWARSSRALLEGHEALTPVEKTVLQLVSEGLSNPAIGERLNVSAQSVKLTLRSIMEKFDVSTRSQAVAVGIRKGLI
ncbi:MAG TPA: response regulator transcription factor [Actinomycetota bacterium]